MSLNKHDRSVHDRMTMRDHVETHDGVLFGVSAERPT